MGDSITLNTRILLATRVFMVNRRSKEDPTKPRALRKVKARRTWLDRHVRSFSSRSEIYSRLEKMYPNTHEAIVHPWNFGT